MPGYTTELSAPPELRMLGIDELVHRYQQCGDPIVERLCYAIETDRDRKYDELQDELEEALYDAAEQREMRMDADERAAKMQKRLKSAEKRIAKLEQQIRNLGGIPA